MSYSMAYGMSSMVNTRPEPSLTRANPGPVQVTIWSVYLSLCAMVTSGCRNTSARKLTPSWIKIITFKCSLERDQDAQSAEAVGCVSELPSAVGWCADGVCISSVGYWDAVRNHLQPKGEDFPKGWRREADYEGCLCQNYHFIHSPWVAVLSWLGSHWIWNTYPEYPGHEGM